MPVDADSAAELIRRHPLTRTLIPFTRTSEIEFTGRGVRVSLIHNESNRVVIVSIVYDRGLARRTDLPEPPPELLAVTTGDVVSVFGAPTTTEADLRLRDLHTPVVWYYPGENLFVSHLEGSDSLNPRHTIYGLEINENANYLKLRSPAMINSLTAVHVQVDRWLGFIPFARYIDFCDTENALCWQRN
jgi:hypothetical protein